MGAREVIARNLPSFMDKVPDDLIRGLSTAGFTIMSKEDVEAVRDKALEEAATVAYNFHIGDKIAPTLLLREALRSLKSGGRDAD